MLKHETFCETCVERCWNHQPDDFRGLLRAMISDLPLSASADMSPWCMCVFRGPMRSNWYPKFDTYAEKHAKTSLNKKHPLDSAGSTCMFYVCWKQYLTGFAGKREELVQKKNTLELPAQDWKREVQFKCFFLNQARSPFSWRGKAKNPFSSLLGFLLSVFSNL